MTDLKSPKPGISRRSFLKATGAAAGAAALVGGGTLTALAEGENSGAEVTGSICCRGNCMNHCELDWVVRDGKLVQTKFHDMPYPEYNRVCLKGLSHVERTYDRDRLKYPIKRQNWSLDNATVDLRGKDDWERISWDDAISLICEKWQSIIDRFGTGAMWSAAMTGSYGVVNGGPMGAYARLWTLTGTTGFQTRIDMNLINGSINALGQGPIGMCNAHADMVNSKTILVWGGNYTQSQIQSWHFAQDSHENGGKLIVIDPTFTASAAAADIWVQVRPGSDGFLACAMCKYLIDEDLVDEEFLKKGSMAPFLLKEDGRYLRLSDFEDLGEDDPDSFYVLDGEGNVRPVGEVEDPLLHGSAVYRGIPVHVAYDELVERLEPYTLDRAQEVCDVDPAVVREVTKIYATNGPAWIYAGFGLDRWTNGYSTCFSVQCLAILAGQLGKPGASAGYAYAMGAQWRNLAMPYMVSSMPLGAGLPNMYSCYVNDVVETGKYMGQDAPIKGIIFNAANPFNTLPDRQFWINGFAAQAEMLVVVDMRMTDTAMYADIVLPCVSWFEEIELTGCITVHGFVGISEQAIEPMYECKTDFEIAKLLAAGMGFPDAYDMTPEEWASNGIHPPEVLEAMGCFDTSISYENLKKQKSMAWCDPYYIHGANYAFPTQTGRAQFYCEELAVECSDYEADLTAQKWPYFEPPYEAWPESVGGYEKTPISEKYPLVYYQEHQHYRVHSSFSHVPVLRELDPEPVVKMNPIDGRARGIEDGDIVRVFNDRGECIVRAFFTEANRPGHVNIPHGWQADQFIGGHYQDLCTNIFNPVNPNGPYFDALVEVELYKGGVE